MGQGRGAARRRRRLRRRGLLRRSLALNQWIKEYAAKSHFVYLDYFSATVDDKGFFKAEITNDGLHPNAAGIRDYGAAGRKGHRPGAREVGPLDVGMPERPD